MFFKYDGVSGRVTSSTQLSAYNPSGLSVASPAPVEFKFSDKSTRPAVVAEAQIGSAGKASLSNARGIIPTEKGYQRVAQLQKVFASHDGLLVWQKFPHDRMGVYATLGLSAFAVGYCVKLIWDMSWPKKQE